MTKKNNSASSILRQLSSFYTRELKKYDKKKNNSDSSILRQLSSFYTQELIKYDKKKKFSQQYIDTIEFLLYMRAQ